MIELNDSTIELLREKHIFFYGNNARYIHDLKQHYPELYSRAEGIIEENPRYRADDDFLPVISTDQFKDKSIDDAAVIFLDDYYQEVYGRASIILNGVGQYFYFLDDATRLELEWKNKYIDVPLERTIIFRSGPHSSQYVKGTDFADNALAVFEYMLKCGYNKEYKLVWLVKNPNEFSKLKEEYENVEFIAFDWNTSEDARLQEKYYKYLFTAKYILFTDAYGFARNCRADQVRIQLWHGCGFKTRTNFVPCEHRYEYNIVISDLYKKIHADIYGLRDDQVIITGYPKSDWLFAETDISVLSKIGVPVATKYIFWLPTFRTASGQLSELNESDIIGETGLPIVSKNAELDELNQLLKVNDTVLIIKPHPFQDVSVIRAKSYSNITIIQNQDMVERGISINQLLGFANALISDYSSIAVEYMLLDRPIAFTLDDVHEYEESRGFVFNPIEDFLPGKEIWDIEDFKEYIGEIINGVDSSAEKRRALTKEMHRHNDGKSCERFVNWMLTL